MDPGLDSKLFELTGAVVLVDGTGIITASIGKAAGLRITITGRDTSYSFWLKYVGRWNDCCCDR